MISVAEARTRILSALDALPPERVVLAAAAGRVLAAPVTATRSQPAHDLSAMDGYAVRAVDIAAPPAALRLIGAAPAGQPFAGRLGPGEAVRIFTGGVVPDGADTIAIQENADAAGDTVTVREAAAPGWHIRRAALDFAAGDILLAARHRLRPRDLALAAAGGHGTVNVHRRPRLALLATGNELTPPGDSVPPGGTVASSNVAIGAMAATAGADVVDLGIVPDDVEAIGRAADAASGADILVTLGGASVGAHDLVRRALEARGMALDFWKIAMRPGKPLMFGRLGRTAVLGLPGNPVSAIVCAHLFLMPALARLAGRGDTAPATTRARLGHALPANDGRADHLRAQVTRAPDGQSVATPLPVQDSSMLRALARADALIVRPPQAPAAEPGEMVDILMLDGCEGVAIGGEPN